MPTPDDRLATNLARILKEKGRSARSVALKASFPDGSRLNDSYIKHILNGRSRNPSYQTLHALADELGVAVSDLTGIPDPSPISKPGEFVKDQDELALLNFWRALDVPERGFMLTLLRNSKLGL